MRRRSGTLRIHVVYLLFVMLLALAGCGPAAPTAVLLTPTQAPAQSPLPSPTISRVPAVSPTPTMTRTPKPTPTRWIYARMTATAQAQQMVPTPTPPAAGMDPVWSPDGEHFAFTRWDGDRPGVYVMRADGTDERLLFGTRQARLPAWTPDGRRVIFSRQNGGRGPQRICIPGYRCFDIPADEYWRLAVVTAAGDDFRDLPSDFHSFSPVVTPDGKWVIYAGDRGLKRVNLETGEQRADR
jgi:Tol biopolymer transport system component